MHFEEFSYGCIFAFNFLLVHVAFQIAGHLLSFGAGRTHVLNVTEGKQTFATNVTSKLDPSPLNFMTILRTK